MRSTLPKTLEKLKQDPRVKDVFMEDNADGAGHDTDYWVWIKRGFADMDDDPCQPMHTIHEWTVRRVMQRMKAVRVCTCKDCVS